MVSGCYCLNNSANASVDYPDPLFMYPSYSERPELVRRPYARGYWVCFMLLSNTKCLLKLDVGVQTRLHHSKFGDQSANRPRFGQNRTTGTNPKKVEFGRIWSQIEARATSHQIRTKFDLFGFFWLLFQAPKGNIWQWVISRLFPFQYSALSWILLPRLNFPGGLRYTP